MDRNEISKLSVGNLIEFLNGNTARIKNIDTANQIATFEYVSLAVAPTEDVFNPNAAMEIRASMGVVPSTKTKEAKLELPKDLITTIKCRWIELTNAKLA